MTMLHESDSVVSQMFHWHEPRDLWDYVTQVQENISDEDLMNRAGASYQKLKEAIVASTFAVGFNELINPVQVRMANDELLDFELQDRKTEEVLEFEIVMAIEPGRRPGLEYRDGQRPQMPARAISGEPIDARWIAPFIDKKTQKARAKNINWRHLLVYQNISGGQTDSKKLLEFVPGTEKTWQSIWLIVGVPDRSFMVLISNAVGFPCDLHKWLPNYQWVTFLNKKDKVIHDYDESWSDT